MDAAFANSFVKDFTIGFNAQAFLAFLGIISQRKVVI